MIYLFGNIDAFGNALERVQRQTEELSRINANNAKTIANTAKETCSRSLQIELSVGYSSSYSIARLFYLSVYNLKRISAMVVSVARILLGSK